MGDGSGTIPKLPFNLPLLKRSALIGVDWGGESRSDPAINHSLMTTLMSWIDQGKLTPAKVVRRPMAEFCAGLTAQLAGEIVGKPVLENQTV